MNITQNDKMLIYASMVKSEKSEILESLTDEQKEDLDQFVTFLRDSFGPTGQEQRFQFQDLKQQADENETNYFLRCEKTYYRSRNIAKPVLANMTNAEKEDISFQFVQGLRNPEVKKLMILNNMGVQYQQIPSIAKSYATSLRDIERSNKVNVVSRWKPRK